MPEEAGVGRLWQMDGKPSVQTSGKREQILPMPKRLYDFDKINVMPALWVAPPAACASYKERQRLTISLTKFILSELI